MAARGVARAGWRRLAERLPAVAGTLLRRVGRGFPGIAGPLLVAVGLGLAWLPLGVVAAGAILWAVDLRIPDDGRVRRDVPDEAMVARLVREHERRLRSVS